MNNNFKNETTLMNDNFKNETTFTTDNFKNETLLYLKNFPFQITFKWQNQSTIIKLLNGEDVFKFADIIQQICIENDIKIQIIKNAQIINNYE